MKEKQLILNRVICLLCDDIIISKHRHDFVMCSCNSVGTDGGLEYIRRIGEDYNMLDMSIYSNKFKDFREYLTWGVNYDKDMNKLPETIWKCIKDLDTDHIEAIINGGHVRNNDFYRDLFSKELRYRRIYRIND